MSEELRSYITKSIFSAIEQNDVVLLRTALSNKISVDVADDNSMTPLQHAAYKGNKEMVQMLLDNGADPNLSEHKHNYTALHFAGLSGSFETCLALLDAGAKPDAINAVNRTPAQMAAFVGHHKCVVSINNYVPKSDVEYYTVINGLETEPLLPPFLSESFHKFIIQINLHPVRVALNLHNLIGISQHLTKIKKVLELMSEKEMKRDKGNNEVLSFKYFYLSYMTGEMIKLNVKQEKDKKVDVVQVFCKNVLKPSKDGSLEFLDCFLRECIKQFPYIECTLFRQMVSTLANKDAPSALSVIKSAINGQRDFFENVVTCYTCGEEKPDKKCSQCKVAQYCDKNCQKLHWYWHKKNCADLAKHEKEGKSEVDVNELSSDIQNLLSEN